MSFVEALNRATRTLGQIGMGAATLPREHEVALVELIFEEIQDGGRQPAPHLALPPHLGSEAEVRGLLSSVSSKDKLMRSDVREWADINRRIVADNAQAVRPLVEAYVIANRLLNDPSDEVEEKRLHTWMETIRAYAKHVFGVDPKECDRNPRAWCLDAMADKNPVPSWVYGDEAPRFVHRAPVDAKALKPGGNMFAGTLPKSRHDHVDRTEPNRDDD